MAVPDEMIQILRCPCAMHSTVEYKDRRSVVLCDHCTAVFPVNDNVPVMLIEAAKPPRGTKEIRTGDGTVIRQP